MANYNRSASHGSYRDRAGTTSSVTSSRYQQEYPPSDLLLTSFVASPIRRASSETRLEALHHKRVVDSLERGMSGREGHGELKKLSSQLFAETASAHTDAHVPASGGGTVGAPPPPAVEHTTHHNQRHDEKEYLNLEFEACFQEHPNTSVNPKIINCLDISYKWTKLVAYYIFVILIGVPATIVWAIMNGLAIFCCVWIWAPQLKLILLCVHSCAPAIVTPVQVICTPIVDVFARCLRQVRVQAIVLGQTSVDRYASAVHTA